MENNWEENEKDHEYYPPPCGYLGHFDRAFLDSPQPDLSQRPLPG